MVINTTQYLGTLFSDGTFILVSDDPLELYQPQKGDVRVLEIFSDGSLLGLSCHDIYPCLDLSQQQNKTKTMSLIKVSEKSQSEEEEYHWFVLTIPQKHLVKNHEEIKFEIEPILGLPADMVEDLTNNSTIMFAGVNGDGLMILASMNKVAICRLASGSMPVDGQIKNSLGRWVKANS